MYKQKQQRQRCANMSAGKPCNAPPPPDSAGSSDASNGEKISPNGGLAGPQGSNKRQKTEGAKPDQMGQTGSLARQRRREKNEIDEKIAQYVGTVADPDGGQDSNMEVDGETGANGDETSGSGGPTDETPVDAGSEQAEDMDTSEGTENPEDTKGNSDTKDTDGDGDIRDGYQQVSEDQAPETSSAQDKLSSSEIKGIKEKATGRSKETKVTKSTDDEQKPDSRDGGDKPEEPKPRRSQQQTDVLGTSHKKLQPKSQGLPPRCQEEWGIPAGPGPDTKISAQKDIQTQRSLQASKQMAYQVFANVLTAIEEQENRESKNHRLKRPEKSAAFIPDQSWKKDDDVLAGVEAQLTIFQAHMGFCPKEVAEAAKVEMIDTTLFWAAARQEIGLPTTPTDRYAINLLEILYDGATSNTFQMLKESRKTFGRSELMENVGKIMAGQAKADQLDKQFRDDPRKEAKALPIRQGQSISNGLERLLNIAYTEGMKKSIRYHLEDHLETVSAR